MATHYRRDVLPGGSESTEASHDSQRALQRLLLDTGKEERLGHYPTETSWQLPHASYSDGRGCHHLEYWG